MEQKNTTVTEIINKNNSLTILPPVTYHMKNMTLFIILVLVFYQKILLTAYSLKSLKNVVSHPGKILQLLCSNRIGMGKAGT